MPDPEQAERRVELEVVVTFGCWPCSKLRYECVESLSELLGRGIGHSPSAEESIDPWGGLGQWRCASESAKGPVGDALSDLLQDGLYLFGAALKRVDVAIDLRLPLSLFDFEVSRSGCFGI